MKHQLSPSPLPAPVLSARDCQVLGLHSEMGGQKGLEIQNPGRDTARAVVL